MAEDVGIFPASSLTVLTQNFGMQHASVKYILQLLMVE
jgi:hypothetical protein